MLARFADVISSNRILVSRVVAIAFFVLLVLTESAQEGSIISGLLFLSGLVLVGVATVGRLWCTMYISGYKGSELITSGPYSISRNPLYFFSLLGWIGIGIATETFSFGIAFALAFWLLYPHIIKREEEYLRGKFGQAFTEYCGRTPRFFPNPKAFHEPESYVVNPRLFRRAMGDALWFIWLVGIIELVEALHEYQFVTAVIRLP
jgi:protein-S-isoprenylcysteine O-methyltransferase Ste14